MAKMTDQQIKAVHTTAISRENWKQAKNDPLVALRYFFKLCVAACI